MIDKNLKMAIIISAETDVTFSQGFFISPAAICQPNTFGAKVPVFTLSQRGSPACYSSVSATKSSVEAGIFSFPAGRIPTMPKKVIYQYENLPPELKECADCHQVIPRSNFHANNSKPDGLMIYCKGCMSDRMADYYQRNKEKVIQYSREYKAKQTDEYLKERSKRYRNSEQGRKTRREQHRDYKKTHRQQWLARATVHQAVKKGKLPKVTTLACEYKLDGCTTQATEYHHYAGYDIKNRLAVKATCLNCHKLIEGRARKTQ